MAARSSLRSRLEVEYCHTRRAEVDWHKLMPRHLAHSRHDAFVKGTLADCVTQRKGAGGDDREHVFAQGLKIFCSHWQLSMRTRFLKWNLVARDALTTSQVP